jgi:site-specific DNA-methyltransferase (adenine-specific)
MTHSLWHGDNLDFLARANNRLWKWDMIFADPPDNIGLGYDECKDHVHSDDYYELCRLWINAAMRVTDTLWWSFNARHTTAMGHILYEAARGDNWAPDWMQGVSCKPCVQTFTFGQHNKHDFGNNHRPLWRITRGTPRVYPGQIMVPSLRQLNGDKRAKEGGRVPGDVFDFPRVTGNSKQRRAWHPTQLHEALVERCILSSTWEDGTVLDIFGGTGTTLRVCKRIKRNCTLVGMSSNYCAEISKEHDIQIERVTP